MQNNDLKFHTPIKVLSFSPKVYDIDYLLNNPNLKHFKGESKFRMHVQFLLPIINKVGWLNVFESWPFFKLWFKLILVANGCPCSSINH